MSTTLKCKDIALSIERLAPKGLAYEWDNVGLLCGDENAPVTKVLLTLDLDTGVVEEAIKEGAQMIIGHHPIMFEPINRVTAQTVEGRLLRMLIKNDISYYAAHTNLDVAKGGLNDLLAKKLGLKNVKILEYTDENGEGIGRTGDTEEPVTLKALCEKVKRALGVDYVRFSGDADALVNHIAINTGGGTALIEAALGAKADVFITGDYKYAQVRHCAENGMKIIDVGHYDTEIIVCELFEQYLSKQFAGALEIVKTKENKNVMRFI
ncbi:MAG: Nif3-like dinuclear metal center hexameric protein [Ruminococcaceae bacterium]|nr:Nif3-like dinuclear metal center hexameric protein [Oscillospiraceae bacterium]